MNNEQLEKELWEAADQLRANSRLTAAEYSMPVLGLIFLRHAENRFKAYLPEIEAGIPSRVPAAQREELLKLGFLGKAAIYLPEQARFETLAALPQSSAVGQAIDAAMQLIEDEVEILQGALPRGYTAFEPDLLADLVKIFNRETLRRASGDVFGRIYEYFLNKFAQSGAQEGGEFFTPPSLVRMIVNVIEPDHGRVLDPACGSAGMFVQTAHFIENVRHQDPNDKVTFFGQEKSDTNTRLARMNLAVHGLDGRILQGNTFYEDHHNLVGLGDFVMANPPFNVDSVDTKKVETQVGEAGRLPFGLPGTNAKSGAISNANSLWIQYFYSFLNEQGRAGFVMASSASDAGNKDRDIREKLVDTGHVDVMVAIGNKFFYTRSLPCTLWFFDRGKPDDLLDQVLMIDARNVFHVVSPRSHVFTEEQLANLTAIVWLYRGEREKFIERVAKYQQQADEWLARIPARIARDTQILRRLAVVLRHFAEQADPAELIGEPGNEPIANLASNGETAESFDAYPHELAAAEAMFHAEDGAAPEPGVGAELAGLLAACSDARSAIAAADRSSHPGQVLLQQTLDGLEPKLKSATKLLEARHKTWLKLLETAEKTFAARRSDAFHGRTARKLRRQLLAADVKKNEPPTVRDRALEALRQAAYFIHQVHWLHSRFPHALFEDVPGLCKSVTRAEIACNDGILTPGRYVGVAPPGGEGEDDFEETLREIHAELAELNDKAVELAERISRNFEELFA